MTDRRLLIQTQPPSEWYNQLGSRKNGIDIVVEYVTSLLDASPLSVSLTLTYEGGDLIATDILSILNVPLLYPNVPNTITIRISEVSRVHNGRKFQVCITPHDPNMLPIITNAFFVKSKPRLKRKITSPIKHSPPVVIGAEKWIRDAVAVLQQVQWIPIGHQLQKTNVVSVAQPDLSKPIYQCTQCHVCYVQDHPAVHQSNCVFKVLLDSVPNTNGHGNAAAAAAAAMTSFQPRRRSLPYPGAIPQQGFSLVGTDTMLNMISTSNCRSWSAISEALMFSFTGEPAFSTWSDDEKVFYVAAENIHDCGCPALSKDAKILGFYLMKHMVTVSEGSWKSPLDVLFIGIDEIPHNLKQDVNNRIQRYVESRNGPEEEKILFAIGDSNCATLSDLKSHIFHLLKPPFRHEFPDTNPLNLRVETNRSIRTDPLLSG